MQEIKKVTGCGIVVKGDNIDTDRIIPARYLKELTFDALGEGVFIDDRNQLKSKGKFHPFDDAKFKGCSVLVVNTNFGCGSSREAAPQALFRYGIRAVIGVTFGEIFFSSSIAIGLPCVKVSEDVANAIQELTGRGSVLVSVSINDEEIIVDNLHKFKCSINEGIKTRLLSGTWDALADLGLYEQQIKSVYESLPYTSWNVLPAKKSMDNTNV